MKQVGFGPRDSQRKIGVRGFVLRTPNPEPRLHRRRICETQYLARESEAEVTAADRRSRDLARGNLHRLRAGCEPTQGRVEMT